MIPVTMLVLVAALFGAWKYFQTKKPSTALNRTQGKPSFKPPSSYAELCALNTNELEHCDVALMNLLCAEGLRGAENLNVSNCLATLDQMAAHVKFETERHLYKFLQNKAEYNNSEGYFRMLMMATVLQQDWDIRYNPDRIPQPGRHPEPSTAFFANSQDVLIHGLARHDGKGTCSSMPVFYIAIGRRLGYPLRLVKAKHHLFARWVDGINGFNIEGTSIGFVSHDDSYYRGWPAPFTAEEEQAESYLKPLTPEQEFSVFASIRGAVLEAANNPAWALGAYAQAFYKDPQSVGNQWLFARAERRAWKAGVLPKHQSLEFEFHDLEIPTGPNQILLQQEKERLQAMLRLGLSDTDVESGLRMLRSQLQTRQAARSPLEPPDPVPGQIVPLLPGATGVEPQPR